MITLELSSVAPDTQSLLPGALGPSLEARGLRRVKGLMLLDLFGDSVPPRFRGRHEGVEAIAAVQAGLAGRS